MVWHRRSYEECWKLMEAMQIMDASRRFEIRQKGDGAWVLVECEPR